MKTKYTQKEFKLLQRENTLRKVNIGILHIEAIHKELALVDLKHKFIKYSNHLSNCTSLLSTNFNCTCGFNDIITTVKKLSE